MLCRPASCTARRAAPGTIRSWGPIGQPDHGDIGEIRARFAAVGQEHVFAFWDELGGDGRDRLASQARRLAPELAALVEARARAVAELDGAPERQLAPPEVLALPERGGDPAEREAAEPVGEAMLAAGRVAAFVVAGGQGTRLGFDGPKGAFPVGPVSDRCLFEIHAQKIRRLRARTGVAVPWYVMTSDTTDEATRELFRERDCFGIDPADVFLFRQGMVPAFDFEGRMLLAERDRIFENPNGHGGALTALADSGALADMEQRGIDTISYFQVDNPLVRIADPVYLGIHERTGAEMSCKVLRKPDPDVKWGVLARIDGRIGIVEYTELDDTLRGARDEEGELRYWAGSPAIHLLSTAFVARVSAHAREILPFHASAKKIPFVDESGRSVSPEAPNGHKLERFVFDALPAARRVALLEVRIEEEFSPVKNAQGAESPESSRRDLSAQYRRWILEAGLEAPPEGGPIEIDHARVDGPEDLRGLGLASLSEAPPDLIRTTSGSPS